MHDRAYLFIYLFISFKNRMDELEEDLPVQGPLPFEPDDAPWKRTTDKSGVRKLYVLTIFRDFSFFRNNASIDGDVLLFSLLITVFGNFLSIKANPVLNIILYRPYLKWVYLLVLVAVLPTKRKSYPLLDNWIIQFAFKQYINRMTSSDDIWHIK